LAADGSYIYTPAANWNGTDSFTYQAFDGADSDVAMVTIDVVHTNDAPVGAADCYLFRAGVPRIVAAAAGVLANDTDVESDPLSAVLDSPPLHGDLTLNPDGSFTFAPDPGYEGDDSFTYCAFDGEDLSAPVTVTLIGTRRYEQTAPQLAWTGTWTNLARTQFSAGTARYASGTGKSVTATFYGTGIDWVGARTTSAGRARIYLDGALVATVDLYASNNRFGEVLYSVSDLPEATHTLRIETTGSKTSASTGTNVWIDCFDVQGELTAP
ncbi:MAG: tandem-95 repeat protein, partial [Actinobacteria bacterium]